MSAFDGGLKLINKQTFPGHRREEKNGGSAGYGNPLSSAQLLTSRRCQARYLKLLLLLNLAAEVELKYERALSDDILSI